MIYVENYLLEMSILKNKINDIRFRVFNLFENLFDKKNKKTQWEIKRLNWYKNRYVFYFLLIIKIIPRVLLHSIEKLDICLIKSWKVFRFRNACSVGLFSDLVLSKLQRRNPPLSVLVVHKLNFWNFAGCVCCDSISILKKPVWWNEYKKIQIILNVRLYEINLEFSVVWSIIVKIFSNRFGAMYFSPKLNLVNLIYKFERDNIKLLQMKFLWKNKFFNFYKTRGNIKTYSLETCVYNYFLF